MTIYVDSVVLRKPEPEDVTFLYAFRNDHEVTQSLGAFSTGYSCDELSQWIKRHNGRSDEVIYVIADRDSNQCLGHTGMYNIDSRARSAEFAILVGNKDYWGRGIGRQVSLAMIKFGFEELNLHRIYLTVLTNNTRAIKLYERLGFKQEGIMRDAQFRRGTYLDVLMMSLLENEYRSSDRPS